MNSMTLRAEVYYFVHAVEATPNLEAACALSPSVDCSYFPYSSPVSTVSSPSAPAFIPPLSSSSAAPSFASLGRPVHRCALPGARALTVVDVPRPSRALPSRPPKPSVSR
ncbi:hypothetical protein D9611_013720 [Ephemerocybe angulata]|uniref:Uncharacterized protein n=1 Tax=Ephemerocybe angulata TaxID=980116 RepID=A0A8H5F1V6_9AGAR|nr:hypothetical protein D9611_013720 [Tulosesus angulatus]